MNDERREIIEGIANAVEIMHIQDDMTLAEAVVFYADEEDGITLKEAEECLKLHETVLKRQKVA